MATKAPIRTCIACGAKGDKRSLVRVVRTPEGKVVLDPKGKAAGRGAYVCCKPQCFAAASKKKLFSAKLRTKIDAAALEELEKEFSLVCASRADESSRDGE